MVDPTMKNEQKLHIFTYATNSFQVMAGTLGISAIKNGASSFRVFTPADLSKEFCERNSETLQMSRGAGYWVWKPFLIMNYTASYPDGELIPYSDAGALLRAEASNVIALVDDNKIHVWAMDGATIENWTDPKVLDKLKVNLASYKDPLIWSGGIVARNSRILRDFAELWLSLCEEPALLRPDSFSKYEKPKGFIWHRHDQSLLSIIVSEKPEWFVVHTSKEPNNWDSIFDLHRNPRIKALIYFNSFPQIRALRRMIVKKLPRKLSRILRLKLHSRNSKPVSREEVNSVTEVF